MDTSYLVKAPYTIRSGWGDANGLEYLSLTAKTSNYGRYEGIYYFTSSSIDTNLGKTLYLTKSAAGEDVTAESCIGSRVQYTNGYYAYDTSNESDVYTKVTVTTYHKRLILRYGNNEEVRKDSTCVYYDGVAQGSLDIVFKAPDIDNYLFTGFASGSGASIEDNKATFTYSASDKDAIANYTEKFTVVFHSNYGTETTLSQACTNVSSSSLDGNSFDRSNYSFVKWNTAADGKGTDVADKETLSNVFSDCSGTAGGTINLYAQWTYIKFDLTVSKDNTAAEASLPSGVGTLKLLNANGDVVSTESSGSLSYAAGTPSVAYTVICDMPNTKPSILYTANGIFNEGSYVTSYTFTPSAGNVLNLVYKFTAKELYSVDVNSNVPSCSASISSPSEDDSDGKYVVGRSIAITTNASAGYEISEARIYNSGGNLIGTISDISANTFTIDNLIQDISVTCVFVKVNYTLDVEIDDASASAIDSVTAEIGTQTGASECTAQYGDTVVFTAILKNSFNGTFAGFYNGNTRYEGSVDPNNPKKYTYSHSVTGGLSLVAKAKASVSLSVAYYNNGGVQDPTESCSVSVTSGGDIVLGNTANYHLNLGYVSASSSDKWIFDAWYDVTSPQTFTNPLDYAASGTFTPTENITLVARVSTAVLTNIVSIHVENGESQTGFHLDASNALSVSPAADSGGWNSTTLEYVYTFIGTKVIRFTAAPTITIEGQSLAFDKFTIGGNTYTESPIDLVSSFGMGAGSTPGKEMVMTYSVAGNRTVNLEYGTVGEHTCDVTMGTFAITETSDTAGVISPDGKSATAARGKTIHIVVTPANGYKFDGWYANRVKIGDPVYTEVDWTMTIITNRTLYAMFSQDTNAVYVWEGGDTNKSFEWRSKTYVSSRPMNPTCCRVDTEGYPLIELDVDMFSAPDSSPTATTTLTNVASQTARRLPVRRSEKYMQICVKNSREVDSVTVATAMGELAV